MVVVVVVVAVAAVAAAESPTITEGSPQSRTIE